MRKDPARLGYCDLCDPVVGLAFGDIPSAPTHRDPKTGKVHAGKLVEVAAREAMKPGEKPGEFLARMVKKHARGAPAGP